MTLILESNKRFFDLRTQPPISLSTANTRTCITTCLGRESGCWGWRITFSGITWTCCAIFWSFLPSCACVGCYDFFLKESVRYAIRDIQQSDETYPEIHLGIFGFQSHLAFCKSIEASTTPHHTHTYYTHQRRKNCRVNSFLWFASHFLRIFLLPLIERHAKHSTPINKQKQYDNLLCFVNSKASCFFCRSFFPSIRHGQCAFLSRFFPEMDIVNGVCVAHMHSTSTVCMACACCMNRFVDFTILRQTEALFSHSLYLLLSTSIFPYLFLVLSNIFYIWWKKSPTQDRPKFKQPNF